jgi:hypothetical protein
MGAPFLNDADRVAALRSYNILDSAPEPAYEEITKLASQVCECPVATIGGWLLRHYDPVSPGAAPCGSERALASIIDGPGQAGAIAGRPAHDHWMNSPGSGRIQRTIRL